MGGRLVRHAGSLPIQLAAVKVTRDMFDEMLKGCESFVSLMSSKTHGTENRDHVTTTPSGVHDLKGKFGLKQPFHRSCERFVMIE